MGEAKRRRQYRGMDVYTIDEVLAQDPREVLEKYEFVVDRIYTILRGRGQRFQAAVLLELLAIFVACHHPDLRENVLTTHFEAVRGLVPIIEKIKFGDGGFPADLSEETHDDA